MWAAISTILNILLATGIIKKKKEKNAKKPKKNKKESKKETIVEIEMEEQMIEL